MTIKVIIREFERGWGNKIDEIKEFDNVAQANEFVKNFNSKNNLTTVPDWYMTAEIA